jgi:hypothetical protein
VTKILYLSLCSDLWSLIHGSNYSSLIPFVCHGIEERKLWSPSELDVPKSADAAALTRALALTQLAAGACRHEEECEEIVFF